MAIRRKMEGKGQTLEQQGTKIRLGIATGNNNVFIIDEEKKNQLVKQDKKNIEIIKPIIRGQDINRYNHSSILYVLLTRNGINVKKDYPTIYEYFDRFGDSFKLRGAKGQHWTNLRACAFFDDFKKEKIIWIELTDKGRFSYSNKEEYLLNSAYFLIPPIGMPIKYLLGVLNSKLIQLYMSFVAATSGMGTLRWINNYIKLLPVPNMDSFEQKGIIKIVDSILKAKENNPSADTSALESEIDRIVYQLYGLTDEEIKIVEQS